MNRIVYYDSLSDDVVSAGKAPEKIPANRSAEDGRTNILIARLIYLVGCAFSFIYTFFVMRVRIVNRKALKKCGKEGFFLYGNHTQPVGDAFAPASYVFPRQIRTVAGADNLGLPIIGKIIPRVGTLIMPESAGEMRRFTKLMRRYIEKRRCIVIYPEAHVWSYCTFIRPFSAGALRFPVMCNAPSYSMTTVYTKRKRGKKPKITVYIDGPFYPPEGGSPKERERALCAEICECMKNRAAKSDCEYISYIKKAATEPSKTN